MQKVLITPSEEANVVLSQLVASKLDLSKDVSLCGTDRDYWRARSVFGFFQISGPSSDFVVGLLRDRAVAQTMSGMPMIDRAASCVAGSSICLSLIGKSGSGGACNPPASDEGGSQ